MTISKKCVLLNSNSPPAVAGGQQKAESERQVRWADYDSMLDEDLQLDTDEANQSCMGVKTSNPCAVYPLTSEGVQGVATREAEWSRSSCPGDAAEGRSPEAEGRPAWGRGVGSSPGYLELGSSPVIVPPEVVGRGVGSSPSLHLPGVGRVVDSSPGYDGVYPYEGRGGIPPYEGRCGEPPLEGRRSKK